MNVEISLIKFIIYPLIYIDYWRILLHGIKDNKIQLSNQQTLHEHV